MPPPPDSDAEPARAAALAEALRRHKAGDLDAAEAAYRAILAVSDHAHALGNLGLIAKARGRLAEAEDWFVRARAVAPDDAVVAYNLGSLYWRAGRLDEAVGPLEFAAPRMRYPGARENLGNVYLGLGRDAEGWPLYDERPERLNAPAHKLGYPEWRGEPLAGKRLLIWGEQGLGDQILAARFVPQLGAAAVTLACEPALVRLFSGLGATVKPRAEVGAVGPHDYWTMMMSLPRWGGAIPTEPYLHGRATRQSGGVGVVWRGNALPDPARSLPPELGAELLDLPGAVSLHPDDTGARDFQNTADLIAGLDVVVSVDTSAAHLAGAMGKRAMVLLKHRCGDWRWRSPPAWYPSVEMLRQPRAGDWRAVLDAVRARLG